MHNCPLSDCPYKWQVGEISLAVEIQFHHELGRSKLQNLPHMLPQFDCNCFFPHMENKLGG